MPSGFHTANSFTWTQMAHGGWVIAGGWSSKGLAQVRLLQFQSPEWIEFALLPSCRAREKLWRRATDLFFATGDFGIPWDELDPTGWTLFQTSIRRVCFHIKPGSQWTYQQLATQAGYPKAARAAGRAMATNPIPLVIPCHRVVGAGGALTGYSGGDGIPTKQWLLDHERGLDRTPYS